MMGLEEERRKDALKKTGNDVNKAIDLMSKEDVLNPKIEKLVKDLISMGFEREKCIKALSECGNDFDGALEILIKDSENEIQPPQIDSNIFGDLKNYYENLTNKEKVAVSHLLIYGDPHEVLELYISCDKDENATKNCLT